jgi:penicillin-binding protein 2
VQNFGRFSTGFSLNMAIGQGNTRVTVLQLAMAYAALANGGTLHVPQLVARVEGPGGEVIQSFAPTVRRRLRVNVENLIRINTALAGVVADRTGTAHNARIEEVTIAGKTGTAQVAHSTLAIGDPRRNWYENRDHAWFAGFAPAVDPEIAIVVLVEHGGSGGHEAAPLVSQIARDWFTRIRPGLAAAPAVPARRNP